MARRLIMQHVAFVVGCLYNGLAECMFKALTTLNKKQVASFTGNKDNAQVYLNNALKRCI